MPQLGVITIADAATTPVNHVFNPSSQNGASARWTNRDPGIPAGYETITHDYVLPASTTAAHRVKIGINLPVLATVDGSEKVVRNSSAQIVFNLSQQSTDQERQDLITLVTDLLGNEDVFASVQNVEQFW